MAYRTHAAYIRRAKRTSRAAEIVAGNIELSTTRTNSASVSLLEEPEVLETSKNVVRYYPKHGKLVFHLPDYYSPRTCSMHIGKGVGLDLTALRQITQTCCIGSLRSCKQIEKSA